MKNYEIFLIRNGVVNSDDNSDGKRVYPNVGRVYVSPCPHCVESAGLMYAGHTLHTAVNFRKRDESESDEAFALRCVAGMSQLFSDITKTSTSKSALITHDEIIVTLMAGCGLPKRPPAEFILNRGEGWLIRMSAYLWQKGYAFEVIGKLSYE